MRYGHYNGWPAEIDAGIVANSITDAYGGSAATFAALPATRYFGTALVNGDLAILTVVDVACCGAGEKSSSKKKARLRRASVARDGLIPLRASF
jgi:hypothetical protein